ncbi:MAG: hypothetical protein CMI53_04330 [Parcubacteria group bacterium]|nr:hypothetical protein [Parcubacteria group bacterium]
MSRDADLSTYTCQRCNITVPQKDRDHHEMYCGYVPKLEEMIDMIPCEYCEMLVKFDKYTDHIERCGRPQRVFFARQQGGTGSGSLITRILSTPRLINDLNTIMQHRVTTTQSQSPTHHPSVRSSVTPMDIDDDDDMEGEAEIDDPLVYQGSSVIPSPPLSPPPPSPPLSSTLSTPPPPLIESPPESPQTTTPVTPDNIISEELLSTIPLLQMPDNVTILSTPHSPFRTEPIRTRTTSSTSSSSSSPPSTFLPPPPLPFRTVTHFVEDTLNTIISEVTQTNLNPNTYENLSNLENVEVGVDDIESVAPITTSKHGSRCPICMNDFHIVRRTLCGHRFCRPCLERWLDASRRCPICMVFLDEKTIPLPTYNDLTESSESIDHTESSHLFSSTETNTSASVNTSANANICHYDPNTIVVFHPMDEDTE